MGVVQRRKKQRGRVRGRVSSSLKVGHVIEGDKNKTGASGIDNGV